MNERLVRWLGIGLVIGIFDLLIISLSWLDFLNLAKWDFVPSIVNGIVSASAILMTVAVFSLNYFNGTITNLATKKRFHAVALRYVLYLFGFLIGGVFFGYFSVVVGLLPIALCFFMMTFFLQCGILFDMWTESQKYCFS